MSVTDLRRQPHLPGYSRVPALFLFLPNTSNAESTSHAYEMQKAILYLEVKTSSSIITNSINKITVLHFLYFLTSFLLIYL